MNGTYGTMTETYIDANKYLSMVMQGAARLQANKKVINDLNVFPIPDGDTGDNMYMTISTGCQAGSACKDTGNLSEMASAIASGMLLGARGNSGVILSRIFSGLSKGLQGLSDADLPAFRRAMEAGVKEAYSSVMTPVEGTILTVLREAVENAVGDDFDAYFNSLKEEMKLSLEHTPDKLAVLKEAGVVDSGGAGMLCIAEGMAESLKGVAIGILTDDTQSQGHAVNLDDFGPDTPFPYGYCTEFLLRLRSDKVDIDSFDDSVVKDYLCEVGESVVCFRDGSVIKVHVHTATPGVILNKMQDWGEFLTVKIENMTLQHSEVEIKDNFSGKDDDSVIRRKVKYGVVAVASGEGVVNAFKEAGVDEVIEGGQTMNPSAGSFIEAFGRMDAETIFVFPNNSNIIMTAGQAASMYDKANVIVIPTKDIGAGYVAAASMDRNTDTADELREAIMGTVSTVRTGLVSKANRNTLKNGIIVRDGDYIGFCDGEVLCDNADRNTAATELCEKIGISEHDIAIVFRGNEVSENEAAQLCASLQDASPMTEIMNNTGEQPVFDYIIVLC